MCVQCVYVIEPLHTANACAHLKTSRRQTSARLCNGVCAIVSCWCVCVKRVTPLPTFNFGKRHGNELGRSDDTKIN